MGSACAKLAPAVDPGPPTFKFGVACAAYQVEGAAAEGGRLPSIWDTFAHTPGRTDKGDTGDVACDFYHRYKEDVALMQQLGVRCFRFSLSWSRILPAGRGEVNQEGVKFYSDLIDALLAAGIEPHVTLYHWDLPQALEDDYGGWRSERCIADFAAYAEVCFRLLGDRVDYWSTLNEPWTFIFLGYDVGIHAPGRSSDRARSPAGDSHTEPWVVTHNALRAHAAAVACFRRLLPREAARISINLNSDWAEPLSGAREDKEAAQRHLDFSLGLFADPIWLGDYPASVRQRVPQLPRFSAEEQAALRGSADYFALNHYTSKWVGAGGEPFQLQGTLVTAERNGRLIGPQADSEWLHVVPWGLGKLLPYIQARYGDPEIHITECGVDCPGESALPLTKALQDDFRIGYLKGYLAEVAKAVSKGVRVASFHCWSYCDNFEWADGYAKRFGIVYVDYAKGLQRHPKASARWLAAYFGGGSQLPPAEGQAQA